MKNFVPKAIGLLLTLVLFMSCKAESNNPAKTPENKPTVSNQPVGSRVFVVERETSSLSVVDIHEGKIVGKIQLSGNMRHATMVFSPDLRYGYVATRNGMLSQIDLYSLQKVKEVKTSDNSIAAAISQDGKFVAIAEYEPGGITILDAKTMTITQKIPANTEYQGKKIQSKVTGLADAGNNSFLCALMDGNEIWKLNYQVDKKEYTIEKIQTQTPFPFDALVTSEARYYMTGHLDSTKVSLVDLWSEKPSAKTIELRPGQAGPTPVKMPHMEAWADAGDKVYVPIPGESALFAMDPNWKPAGKIALIGNPVYALVHPNHREIWVSFSGKNDGKIQVISIPSGKTIKELDLGERIYHTAFTPRGDLMLVSSNKTNELIILDARNYQILHKISIPSPSGIFGVWRAFQIGL